MMTEKEQAIEFIQDYFKDPEKLIHWILMADSIEEIEKDTFKLDYNAKELGLKSITLPVSDWNKLDQRIKKALELKLQEEKNKSELK